jgi:hypothetical protein
MGSPPLILNIPQYVKNYLQTGTTDGENRMDFPRLPFDTINKFIFYSPFVLYIILPKTYKIFPFDSMEITYFTGFRPGICNKFH